MAKHTGGRERVCVTCDNPSPGPIRHLYYRWRLHGPFFPLLERLKTEENVRLFANGRVPVCNSCANYLQRQWNEYERKSITLPMEKRTYRLLSDERWEKLNHKSHLDKAASRVDERPPEISSNEENENPQLGESRAPYKSRLPVPCKSKIPRLSRNRRKQQTAENAYSEMHDTSIETIEQDALSEQELTLRIRTAATEMVDRERSTLLRKLAEIKFQEELDYVQRKVQKTMGMVHLKGRDERIPEIEKELEERLGNAVVKHDENEREVRNENGKKMILPLTNNNVDGIRELEKHIKQEMTMQRREIDKMRESIKSEIAQAMDDSYNRNEEMWHFMIEMNEKRRSEKNLRRRPYSDLNKPMRSKKNIWEAERLSDGYGARDFE